MLKIKVKKLHPEAKIPAYAKFGDGAVDLTAVSKTYNEETGNIEFGLGLSVEIPEGYLAFLLPRSSVVKTPLDLANSVGLIDSGYRGELKAVFRTIDRPRKNYEIGDRVVQMLVLPYPKIEFEEVTELSNTERGVGGFGHTGK